MTQLFPTIRDDEYTGGRGRVDSTVLELARGSADDADRTGEFPAAILQALCEREALAAALPTWTGGCGLGLRELAADCRALGSACGSSGMILAMHHAHAFALSRHVQVGEPAADHLRQIATTQRLIASGTSEVGVQGLRASRAALEERNGELQVEKRCAFISYGERADDLLVSVRAHANAAPSDQRLVLLSREQYDLEPTSNWNALGMRATCSRGFKLTACVPHGRVLTASFGQIAARSLVPACHVLWAAVWIGIAHAAYEKTLAWVRERASSSAFQLSQLARMHAQLSAVEREVCTLIAEYEELDARDAATDITGTRFMLAVNDVKVSVSERASELCLAALELCGIDGYRNDTPFAVGRHVRDILSARSMVGNAGILAGNGVLLMAGRPLPNLGVG